MYRLARGSWFWPLLTGALGLLALEEAIDLLAPADVDPFARGRIVLAQREEDELFLMERSELRGHYS